LQQKEINQYTYIQKDDAMAPLYMEEVLININNELNNDNKDHNDNLLHIGDENQEDKIFQEVDETEEENAFL
jgi:hypothetical protein